MNQDVKNKIEDFYKEHKESVDDLASYVGVPPLWLVCVFYTESALNFKVVNSIGATGLNQLMPDTARGLAIDLEKYKNSIPYQLEQMKKFFAPIRGKVRRAGDLYLYNFLPAAVTTNVPFDKALGESGSKERIWNLSKGAIYSANKGLDFNKDGKITRQDIFDLFESRYDDLINESPIRQKIRDTEVTVLVVAEREKKNILIGMALVTVSATLGMYLYLKLKTAK